MDRSRKSHCRYGHTLMELVVASVASTALLAGLGSVMMIARQVAYTPSAATQRAECADVVSQMAEELRFATIVTQQSSRAIEFIVTDRNSDGIAEKIRYEWSGTAGDPLYKQINSATAVPVLDSVQSFLIDPTTRSETITMNSEVESAVTLLTSDTNLDTDDEPNISTTNFLAQQINPALFNSVPANAVSWNATQVDYYCKEDADSGESLLVQLRSTGEPFDGPTSAALGEVSISAWALTSGWNSATFPSPARKLSLHRQYAFALCGVGGIPAQIRLSQSAGDIFQSTDGGESWQSRTDRRMFYRLYGSYNIPGATYTLMRNYVSHARLLLQAGSQSHSRIDARIPLRNSPEIVSGYWRADFDANPVTSDANGDGAADWEYTGGGNFDATNLVGGIWNASGALETRPPSNFTTATIVECRCRNTTVGGTGAVLRINADRQGGAYAPLLVYVQRQSDGTQNLVLNGKTSDAVTRPLYTCTNLSSELVRFRLIILPQSNVVNLTVNDEDQGTFTYPTYTPSSSTDRYLTLYGDTSQAEFDYIDVRAMTN